MNSTPNRFGNADAGGVSAKACKDSSHGNAMVTPAPRRTVRREMRGVLFSVSRSVGCLRITYLSLHPLFSHFPDLFERRLLKPDRSFVVYCGIADWSQLTPPANRNDNHSPPASFALP